MVVTYPFSDEITLLRWVQHQMNTFPVDDTGKRQVGEFGFYLFQQLDSTLKVPAWSHIAFPEIMVYVQDADASLKDVNAVVFPQLRLAADKFNNLYIVVMSDKTTTESILERQKLIIPFNRVHINSNILDMFSEEAQNVLTQSGFGSKWIAQQWAEKINENQPFIHQNRYGQRDDFINLNEIPFSLARVGSLGTLFSYNLMPEFILSVINNNKFFYKGQQKNILEIGSGSYTSS